MSTMLSMQNARPDLPPGCRAGNFQGGVGTLNCDDGRQGFVIEDVTGTEAGS
tara:strand:- start:1557 stop:1712 length:156 start_codon:yes stop_codon:yes gene_type:complete